MNKEIIVSNDCCDYKLEGGDGILLYNDEKATRNNEKRRKATNFHLDYLTTVSVHSGIG